MLFFGISSKLEHEMTITIQENHFRAKGKIKNCTELKLKIICIFP